MTAGFSGPRKTPIRSASIFSYGMARAITGFYIELEMVPVLGPNTIGFGV